MSKKATFFLLSFMFFLLQNWRTGGQNRFCPEVEVGGLGECFGTRGRKRGWERGRRMNTVQIMYTYICKCKNDTC
jgi:hypothetical protein